MFSFTCGYGLNHQEGNPFINGIVSSTLPPPIPVKVICAFCETSSEVPSGVTKSPELKRIEDIAVDHFLRYIIGGGAEEQTFGCSDDGSRHKKLVNSIILCDQCVVHFVNSEGRILKAQLDYLGKMTGPKEFGDLLADPWLDIKRMAFMKLKSIETSLRERLSLIQNFKPDQAIDISTGTTMILTTTALSTSTSTTFQSVASSSTNETVTALSGQVMTTSFEISARNADSVNVIEVDLNEDTSNQETATCQFAVPSADVSSNSSQGGSCSTSPNYIDASNSATATIILEHNYPSGSGMNASAVIVPPAATLASANCNGHNNTINDTVLGSSGYNQIDIENNQSSEQCQSLSDSILQNEKQVVVGSAEEDEEEMNTAPLDTIGVNGEQPITDKIMTPSALTVDEAKSEPVVASKSVVPNDIVKISPVILLQKLPPNSVSGSRNPSPSPTPTPKRRPKKFTLDNAAINTNTNTLHLEELEGNAKDANSIDLEGNAKDANSIDLEGNAKDANSNSADDKTELSESEGDFVSDSDSDYTVKSKSSSARVVKGKGRKKSVARKGPRAKRAKLVETPVPATPARSARISSKAGGNESARKATSDAKGKQTLLPKKPTETPLLKKSNKGSATEGNINRKEKCSEGMVDALLGDLGQTPTPTETPKQTKGPETTPRVSLPGKKVFKIGNRYMTESSSSDDSEGDEDGESDDCPPHFNQNKNVKEDSSSDSE